MKSSLISLKNSVQDRALFAVKALAGSIIFLYAVFMVQQAYMVSGWKDVYQSQKREAAELALSYDSVRLAGGKLSNKPVLWLLAVTAGGQWHYQADTNRPVEFLNRPDLTADHKGIGVYTILAIIRGAGPKGVTLQYLENY